VVGRISYSLYLWQQLYLANFEAEAVATGPLALVQDFPLGLPAALATAAASYYLVEQPIRRWGYQWIRHAYSSRRRITATTFVWPQEMTTTAS
jgi:peptidoglycan/LPS O-acetylase OafA/YrhL